MKTAFQILVLLVISLIPGSCHKDDAPVVIKLYNTWEVKEFISLHSVNYSKDKDNKILLTFNQGETYQLKLDVNTCSGTFVSKVENLIAIDFPACTEVCCDSEFSNKFTALLPSVTSYTIKGNTLDMNVPNWGTIRSELVK
jgi:hypothetical protein